MPRRAAVPPRGPPAGGGRLPGAGSGAATGGPPGQGYPDTVLDHFERPRNNGALENANAIGYMTNPVCGDTLLLMLRVRDDRIEEARWQSDGCVASIAAGS